MPRSTKSVADSAADQVLDAPESTLLDLLDNLLNKGVMANGDVTLGVAGIDLIYLRLSALLCAADRVLPTSSRGASRRAQRRRGKPPLKKAREEDSRPPCQRRRPAYRQAQSRRKRPPVTAAELRALKDEIEKRLGRSATIAVGKQRTAATRTGSAPMRWNPEPEDVQKSVAQLVLTIVEFLRRLMERQAIRRMEQKTLTKKEVEAVGAALMTLEQTIRDIGSSSASRRRI